MAMEPQHAPGFRDGQAEQGPVDWINSNDVELAALIDHV
jgi:hypothetical protein